MRIITGGAEATEPARPTFTLQEVRAYVEWLAAARHDELPLPRVESERRRLERVHEGSEEHAWAVWEFRRALLAQHRVLSDEDRRSLRRGRRR